jgi:hypothetical protein
MLSCQPRWRGRVPPPSPAAAGPGHEAADERFLAGIGGAARPVPGSLGVAELRERGVPVQEAPELGTVDGMADLGFALGAWFIDPATNWTACSNPKHPLDGPSRSNPMSIHNSLVIGAWNTLGQGGKTQ